MGLHRNARLGLAGRRALVADVEAGCSCREAPRRLADDRLQVVAALVRADHGAALIAGLPRGSLVAAAAQSAAFAGARAGPDLRGASAQRLGSAADCRRDRPSARDGLADAQAGRHLAAGEGCPRAGPPLRVALPGRPLHIDSKRFVRFGRPGHAVTGDRHRSGAELRMHVGYEWVHSLVDDHSRYAYSELHRDQRAATVTGFVERGLAHFAEQGIEAKRLLSDNAFVYRHNRSLRELLAAHAIRHLFIRPRRPQTNGNVERYQQTLKREWALGQIYRSSNHRAQALSHWLRHSNETRPHGSLGGRPPISRVHNVPRQDT